MDKAKRYPVRSLISFDALENPSWHSSTRSKETPTKTVKEMINSITQYHKRWEKAVAENRYHEDLIKKVKEDFLVEFDLRDETKLNTTASPRDGCSSPLRLKQNWSQIERPLFKCL